MVELLRFKWPKEQFRQSIYPKFAHTSPRMLPRVVAVFLGAALELRCANFDKRSPWCWFCIKKGSNQTNMLAVDWASQAKNETSLTQHVKTQLKFDYGYWGLWFFGVYFLYNQLGQFQSITVRSKMLQINIATEYKSCQPIMAKVGEFQFIMTKL